MSLWQRPQVQEVLRGLTIWRRGGMLLLVLGTLAAGQALAQDSPDTTESSHWVDRTLQRYFGSNATLSEELDGQTLDIVAQYLVWAGRPIVSVVASDLVPGAVAILVEARDAGSDPDEHVIQDFWYGKVVQLPSRAASEGTSRPVLVPGIRFSRVHYFQRPTVRQDTLASFHHNKDDLVALSYQRLVYYRTNFLLGMGIENPGLVFPALQVRLAALSEVQGRGVSISFNVGNPEVPTSKMPGIRPGDLTFE